MDGEEFFQSNKWIDLLILDIEMPNMNGIEVKKRLQEINQNTIIIFVTSHEELVLDAFGINVYGFVNKEAMEKQLAEMLNSAIVTLNQIVWLEGKIDSRKIIYIKSEHIYSKIAMCDATEQIIRISLSELEKKLSIADFIRVHKSYLVNPKWILKIKDKEIITEKEKIPIAVRMKAEVKRKYREYCEKNARYC